MDVYWQLEVKNPWQSANWKALWKFDEEQVETYKELVMELNLINAPVQFRIESKLN
jgi:hypothetical protein